MPTTMRDQPFSKRDPQAQTTAAVAPTSSSVLQPAPPITAADTPAAHPPAPAHTLTPEEQMALYEKDLKENDWGHQPG